MLASSRTLPGHELARQRRERLVGEVRRMARPQPRGEVSDQVGNVAEPLAQRRHLDRKHVQPEVEVFAERARRHRILEPAVGGRERPDVDMLAPLGADALDLAALEHPQQLGLGLELQVADLVEEQRAAVGQLEAPDAPIGGAGERAALVAEHLALDQVARNRGAVDRDERPARARGE